jgi:hypothetical protein
MRTLVESLKRLHEKGKLTREQVAERVAKGSISADEFQHITGEEYVAPEGSGE